MAQKRLLKIWDLKEKECYMTKLKQLKSGTCSGEDILIVYTRFRKKKMKMKMKKKEKDAVLITNKMFPLGLTGNYFSRASESDGGK